MTSARPPSRRTGRGSSREAECQVRESARQEGNLQVQEKLDDLAKSFELYYEMGQEMARAYIRGGPR